MKKLLLSILMSIVLLITATAQAPQGISYQAVARNSDGQPIENQEVAFRIGILQGTVTGTMVYAETHAITTNEFGLVNLTIGQGEEETGTFAAINWAEGPYFLQIELDVEGGTDYAHMGTSQFLSVPYALFAEKVAGSVAANIYPPTVVATEASNIESFSATLNGIVNAEGFSSTVVFEFGTTTAYGTNFTAIQSPVTGSADVMVSANRSNLQSATTYHYRIRATNAVNVSYSEDMQFTTEASAPQLTTNTVNILAFSATSGGNITYDGGSPVTARGVVWSTNPDPTLDDNFTVDGAGTGSYTSEMTGLTHATPYFVRAYATNAVGTTYGNQRTFTTQNGIIALTTNTVTNITTFSATSGGNITADGGTPVIARGLVWSTNPNPTLDDNFTVDGVGSGEFTSEMTGLTLVTTYYIRAYATNAVGTTYGNQLSFTTYAGIPGEPCIGSETITDADGNVYNTVVIASQCWMQENLKTTKYRNGTPIEYPGTDNSAWQNNTIGAYAWYNNDINWKDSYGALYNWHAVNHANGLCPAGWHVPTDAEFTAMTNHFGGASIAGGKMKSTRTDPDPHPRWESPNTGATNESNWSALPGGNRSTNGDFYLIGNRGFWWSSTEHSSSNAWHRRMDYGNGNVGRYTNNKGIGFSVRCLRDID